MKGIRSLASLSQSWTRERIAQIYDTPLMDLVYKAATVHREYHDPKKVQLCTLLNIKSGGCTEDCSYCSQSSRYKTDSPVTKLLKVEDVLAKAREAKANGSTRFCMGAAWRDMTGRKTNLKNICEMVKEIRSMGMEVCTTLGMLNEEQVKELKDAGLTAYNHNIDTSREHYPNVITTRSFDERLQTIDNVKKAGIKVCTGGILGLGETREDRVSFLATLAQIQPESLPINALVPIEGTPLFKNKKARVVMPKSIIRLAAGRISMTEMEQAMCFMAGANAVFTGEKMLTTKCSGYFMLIRWEEDKEMFGRWGLEGLESFDSTLKEEIIPATTATSTTTATATASVQ